MKQKTIEIYPNAVVVARYHNRRITVAKEDDVVVIKFTKYAPNEQPQPGQAYERGIMTTVIAISKEGAAGLMQAINEVLNQ